MRLHATIAVAGMIAATILSVESASAQVSSSPGVFAVELQRVKPPAKMTPEQTRLLDGAIAALQASGGELTAETRGKFALFVQSYFTKAESAKVSAAALYLVRSALVTPNKKHASAVAALAQYQRSKDSGTQGEADMRDAYQDYNQAVQTLAAIQKQVYDDAMNILANLKS